MKQMICAICSYAFEEAAGIPAAGIPVVCLGDDGAVAVSAYCNLRGLWMTEVKHAKFAACRDPAGGFS